MSENPRKIRRSVSFADQSNMSKNENPSQVLSQSHSADFNEKLSIHEEHFSIPEPDENTPLLEQFTKSFVDSQTNPENSVTIKQTVTKQTQGGAHWISGAFLLMSAALGAGLLNYPVAYDRMGGIGLSTIAQIIVLIMLFSTMLILIYCSDLNQDNSYHQVLLSMCGKRTQQMAAVSIMTSCFGICITFLIIIGDQFDRIFATFIGPQFCYQWVFHRYSTISITTLVFIWPMSYFKRLEFLRHFNLLGIFAMLYVVFLNVYEYYMLDFIPGPIKTSPDSIVSVFAALPVICFAYQTHEIVVPVYACMSDRKISSFSKATALALSLLLILYCISGTFGYLTFGGSVAPDILSLYNPLDPIVTAGIVALIIKMIATYPQVVFCGRDTFVGLFFNESREQSARREFWYRISITTVWNSMVLLLSIITPNITISIGFLGSIAACNVFVFPGLCMVSLAKRQLSCRSSSVLFNKLMLIYGIVIVLTGSLMFVIVLIRAVNDLQADYESVQLCK